MRSPYSWLVGMKGINYANSKILPADRRRLLFKPDELAGTKYYNGRVANRKYCLLLAPRIAADGMLFKLDFADFLNFKFLLVVVYIGI